jgi:hypothetical protein
MAHRCAGRVPRALRVEHRAADGSRRERDVAIGECPACGAWVYVMPNGTMHPHVNQQLRAAAARGQLER